METKYTVEENGSTSRRLRACCSGRPDNPHANSARTHEYVLSLATNTATVTAQEESRLITQLLVPSSDDAEQWHALFPSYLILHLVSPLCRYNVHTKATTIRSHPCGSQKRDHWRRGRRDRFILPIWRGVFRRVAYDMNGKS